MSDEGLSIRRAEGNPAEHTAADVARLLAERSLPSGRGGIAVWAWIVAEPPLWFAANVAFLVGGWEWFWPLVAALITSRAISRTSRTAAELRAALLLPELDGEWLPALVDGLHYPNSSVRFICRARLTTVLPHLAPEVGERLSHGRRALLFDQLTPAEAHRQPDFLSSIIEFGAALGDAQALGAVDRLAGMRVWSRAQRRVRDSARRWLPELENRVAKELARSEAAPGDFAELTGETGELHRLSPEAQSWLDRRERETARQPGMRFGFLLACWGVIVPYLVYQTVELWRAGSLLPSVACAVLTATATQLYRLTLTPQQAHLAGILTTADDIQAVGPIAEMLSWPDDRIKSMALSALTRLFPRLKSSDTHLLNRPQRAQLYSMLTLNRAGRHAEFQIALLAALEQVGDIEALPIVRSLAEGEAHTVLQRRVVRAAQACLPYLEGCAQQNRDSQVLLRAFTDGQAESSLLRPAGRRPDMEPDLLVRSATLSEPP